MTEVLGKKELVARLSENTGTTKVQSAKEFDNFIEVIKTALEAGETVRIPGLATLTSEVKEAHTMEMYDFQAGDGSRKTVEVPEKRVYKARFSKALSK
ncbi:HU family DNA-binding protein [Lactobacillus sp. AN1001]